MFSLILFATYVPFPPGREKRNKKFSYGTMKNSHGLWIMRNKNRLIYEIYKKESKKLQFAFWFLMLNFVFIL